LPVFERFSNRGWTTKKRAPIGNDSDGTRQKWHKTNTNTMTVPPVATTNTNTNRNQNNTMNDFHDFTGRARKFFDQNKESILRSLSGGARHEEGDFDWYSDWQAWAQQQWEQQAKQQQQQQHYNQRHQNYRQRQRATNARKTDDPSSFRWPFDPGDPYSVLGIDDRRNVTDAEVSNAFRKQMLRYHPDTQPNATSQAQKRRYTERSKLITEAYRTIKTDRKNTKHGKQSN